MHKVAYVLIHHFSLEVYGSNLWELNKVFLTTKRRFLLPFRYLFSYRLNRKTGNTIVLQCNLTNIKAYETVKKKLVFVTDA